MGGLPRRHPHLSLGAEGFGRVEVDGRLAVRHFDRSLEVAMNGRWAWGRSMRAEALGPRWGALLLSAALLAAGCAARGPGPGPRGGYGLQGALGLGETAGGGLAPPASPAAGASEPGAQGRLRHRRSARLSGSEVAMGGSAEEAAHEEAGTQAGAEGPAAAECQPLPPGWPKLSSGDEALLAPLLSCPTPAAFIALQDRVDMARLVEALGDWSAVRLSALGPVRQPAAEVLNRKRASFLASTTERYGAARAEVFALFLLHAAFVEGPPRLRGWRAHAQETRCVEERCEEGRSGR